MPVKNREGTFCDDATIQYLDRSLDYTGFLFLFLRVIYMSVWGREGKHTQGDIYKMPKEKKKAEINSRHAC